MGLRERPYKGELPTPTLATANGWLAPDGTLYPCEWAEHRLWAMRLCRRFKVPGKVGNDELDISDAGWIILKSETFLPDLLGGMTRAQKQAIRNYEALHRHSALPEYLPWDEVTISDPLPVKQAHP